MKTISLSFVVAFVALASSSASAEESEPGKNPLRRMPVFPAWETLGKDCSTSLPSLESPNTSAVLVAPGYLVAPAMPFRASRDFGLDPSVCLFDLGTQRMVRARLVDVHVISGQREEEPGLVLIKTDANISGTPVSLAPNAGKPTVAMRFPPVQVQNRQLFFVADKSASTPCDPSYERTRPIIGYIDVPLRGLICVRERYRNYVGVPLFTSDYAFAGMLTFEDNSGKARGLDLERVREFVTSYFASWGRHLKDKPKL